MALSKVRQVWVDGKKKHTKEYSTWSSMRQRCNNPNNHAYKDYGGRGIKVCDRWNESFDNFLHDMGPAPHLKMTLERTRVNDGYSKENCVWASYKVQANNTRSNRIIEYNGIKDTFIQTAEREGLNYKTLWHQVTRQGLTIDQARENQNKRKNKTPITKEILIDLYVNKNLNCRDTAKALGWEKGSVQKKLHEFGIPVDRLRIKNKRSFPKNLNHRIDKQNRRSKFQP